MPLPASLSVPTHLSIFVTDPDSGRPVARLPLYAEVAVPRILRAPPINERFREPIRAALYDVDPTAVADEAVRDGVEAAALQALAESVDEASSATLVSRPDRVRELFLRVFREVLDVAGVERMSDIQPHSELKPRITEVLRRVGVDAGLVFVPEARNLGTVWADPLGVLTTDHVGYASFDLKRLRPEVQLMLVEAIDARRNDPDAVLKLSVWIYPYGQPTRVDALTQARFAFDAIVARLFLKWNTLPPALQNMGPRALQNPSLTDWRLSPASFAASPKTLVGENGCEELVPANLALQEFVLRQVVRLVDVPANFGLPAGFKAAYVDDYKVSWFSLGHSLGEIQYSLPLAPGETVKLAVIDWSWDSLTKRDETTRLTEEILHQTHRDRTITETVKAGLRELQHGSSFMGGTASAAGGSGSGNIGVVGLGAAVGNTWSLGGSTATSEGSRDLAAENVQRVNDSFSQASSAQREINSTVVIQARQEEKESIQTRTFSNYNHSHTLTVLYYQVLRHYRVTVEWVRRRPAVLVHIPPRVTNFDAATLIGHRALLEPNLLDASLKTAFDLLEKQEAAREHQALNAITPSDNWIGQWWEGDIELSLFEFAIRTGEGDDETDETAMINLILVDGTTIARPLVRAWDKAFTTDNVNVGKRFNYKNDWAWFIAKPDVPVRWRQLMGFEFVLHDDDEWRITGLAINAFHAGGSISLVDMRDVSYWFPLNSSSQTVTYIKRPGPPPPMLPPPHRAPEKQLSVDEYHQVRKLIDHFARYKDYYNRILRMGTDPTTVAIQMEGQAWTAGQVMADHVDPAPLEVFGSYTAYALAKQVAGIDDTVVVDVAAALNGNDAARRQWAMDRLAAMSDADRQSVLERLPLASAKSERLITMSTRGVFAEGKLGHCNVSEEIDNTRFWKWEEHPIPFEAPGINPVTPIQPQPQQVSAAPTPFPQSLVNIVNPSPAPDPNGLAAALSLLGTPNIFRDMSGRQEVADLLKKLSDNSISIAEAANRAREIQAKYGTNLQATTPPQSSTTPTTSAANQPSTPPTATPEEKERAQIENDERKLDAADKHLPPEQKAEVRNDIVEKWTQPAGAVAQLSLDDNDAHVRSFFPPKNGSGESYLVGRIEGGDASQVTSYYLEVLGGESRGSVEWKGSGGLMTKLFAKRPGICGIHAKVLSGTVAQGREAGAVISVPLFAHMSGTAADLQAVFASWNMASHAEEVVRRAEMYAWSIVEGVNLRFIWSLEGFINAQVPTQFNTGGFAENFLTRVVLTNTSPTNQLAEVQTIGAANEPAFNGSVTLSLGLLATDPVVGSSVTGLAGALASAAPPAGIETFAIEYFARLISSVSARAVCLAVLGPQSAGAAPTLAELTGHELDPNGDTSDPAAYTDVGREAMRLRGATITTLSELFPVPPRFK